MDLIAKPKECSDIMVAEVRPRLSSSRLISELRSHEAGYIECRSHLAVLGLFSSGHGIMNTIKRNRGAMTDQQQNNASMIFSYVLVVRQLLERLILLLHARYLELSSLAFECISSCRSARMNYGVILLVCPSNLSTRCYKSYG